MEFYSTNRQSRQATLEEAVMTGLPADGGLYMPERIPLIPRAFFNNIAEMSVRDISYVVATTILGDDIDPAELKEIVHDTFTFDIPLRKISDTISVLELFHGPTHAFKDLWPRQAIRGAPLQAASTVCRESRSLFSILNADSPPNSATSSHP